MAEHNAPLGITGSTGNLGGRIARRLADVGAPQRLLVRDPARAPELPGTTVHRATYSDGESVADALDGVRVALMVSGSESADRVTQHSTFIDAAARAGVEHLVYISFVGAGAAASTFTLVRDHHATEGHIRGSGMRFTFLRDNMYADFLPMLAGDDGVIRGPAGNGRIAAVAQDDIADVAVEVLLHPERHTNVAYSLTGPEALGLEEVAAVLTRATGRRYTYHDETIEEAHASRAVYGAPDWQVEAWVSTYTAIAAGDLETVTDDVARLTGHPATSLEELMRRRPR
ncbi:SDR family oxidoreductase [Tessaracoccus sp. OS52]|uniref:SDR family oxidoreductase n=1 Tax=Tessaracoccus sp. OS52 TaxID=2886691 RepID=UPI001D118331|nr:SDR family oxidoreductase [Tessaracoccus sp. OS52]MCC2591893.1 SDR family oxidoreductase [Tessaracoccus sp. OS52]